VVTSPGARAASIGVDESDGLTWLPAWRLRELIVTGEVSSVEVVRHFLARIEALDPTLHAFRRFDAEGALDQARRADEAVRTGQSLGPLHGVPIAVKELFFVTGFPVPGSYSSYLEDRVGESPVATRDDVEVERLLQWPARRVGCARRMPVPRENVEALGLVVLSIQRSHIVCSRGSAVVAGNPVIEVAGVGWLAASRCLAHPIAELEGLRKHCRREPTEVFVSQDVVGDRVKNHAVPEDVAAGFLGEIEHPLRRNDP
jgi:hypothetical protein